MAFSLNVAHSQINKSYYFIAGHIYYDLGISLDKSFYSYLFKWNKKSTLDTILEIDDETTSIDFIKSYQEIDKIILSKHEWEDKSETQIGIIDMKHPNKINWLPTSGLYVNGTSAKNMVWVNDTIPYFMYRWVGINMLDYSIDTNLYAKDVILNPILSGAVGGMMYYGAYDYLRMVNNINDKNITIPITADINKRPILPIVLPDSLNSKDHFYALLKNTKKYYIIWISAKEGVAKK